MIRPALIIPVGKLAIGRFLGDRPLDESVGRRHQVEHVGGASVVIPLPHPSGASSWIHAPGHMLLVDAALALIGDEMRQLEPGAKRSGRSAA
jgi:uracil-DNA glycosylase